MMSLPEFRTVEESQTTITELMIPAYANFGGKVHGGLILSLMDKVAYACAAKHAGGYNVTASMNGVDFLAPVEVGDLVHLMASVNYVGNSSMVIGVKVISENFHEGIVKHTNSSYLTMVATDENGSPRPVPGLILSNKDQVRRCLEAIKRREMIKGFRQELANAKKSITLTKAVEILRDERIHLELPE